MRGDGLLQIIREVKLFVEEERVQQWKGSDVPSVQSPNPEGNSSPQSGEFVLHVRYRRLPALESEIYLVQGAEDVCQVCQLHQELRVFVVFVAMISSGFHLAKEDLHFRVHFKDPGQALSLREPANLSVVEEARMGRAHFLRHHSEELVVLGAHSDEVDGADHGVEHRHQLRWHRLRSKGVSMKRAVRIGDVRPLILHEGHKSCPSTNHGWRSIGANVLELHPRQPILLEKVINKLLDLLRRRVVVRGSQKRNSSFTFFSFS